MGGTIHCVVLLLCVIPSLHAQYTPDWKSIDSRPLPPWYDESKFGIFIHWGVFSVPSFGDEWFWNFWKSGQKEYVDFMNANYKPNFEYADFAADFTAELFNPDTWAEIFAASGAKYVVLTSKHHEGFTNWPSKYSFSWNSQDVGPKRDLVGELAASIRKKTNIHFGLYHSMFEWYNPLFLEDKANNFTTQYFVKSKTLPELYEIVNTYKPEVIWSDGAPAPDTYWNSTTFLAWLYNSSPVKDTVVVNDRWGDGCTCKHGGYLTCNDRYVPGKLPSRKWENCMTIDSGSWGYRRNVQLSSYLTINQLLTSLAKTVSLGGNMLLNVGPTKDGRILPIFEERLRQMGSWLAVNGDAIYATKPWKFQNDTVNKDVWYTSKKGPTGGIDVYAIVLTWPTNSALRLGAPVTSSKTNVTMLGYPGRVQWQAAGTSGMNIVMPNMDVNQNPSQYAWVMKLQNVGP